jgi:hypothetical protein
MCFSFLLVIRFVLVPANYEHLDKRIEDPTDGRQLPPTVIVRAFNVDVNA